MKKCEKCGHKAEEHDEIENSDNEVSLKEEILEELLEMMQSSVGDKLKAKKAKVEDY